MVEQVLVVPAQNLTETLDKFKIKFVNGFLASNNGNEILQELLAHSHFMDRPAAELDPNFKQFIPYCLLKSSDKFFVYKRTKKGQESRLHDLYSLGIGGHCNPCDQTTYGNMDMYKQTLTREMEEEVGLGSKEYYVTDVGFIYDDSNSVGMVHVGVIHVLVMNNPNKEIKPENTLSNWSFESVDVMKRNSASFENWSKIIIDSGVL